MQDRYFLLDDALASLPPDVSASESAKGLGICRQCGWANKLSSKFCVQCGTKLSEQAQGSEPIKLAAPVGPPAWKFCAKCGSSIRDEKFCGMCGQTIPRDSRGSPSVPVIAAVNSTLPTPPSPLNTSASSPRLGELDWKGWATIGIAGLLVFIVIVGTVAILSRSGGGGGPSPSPQGNSSDRSQEALADVTQSAMYKEMVSTMSQMFGQPNVSVDTDIDFPDQPVYVVDATFTDGSTMEWIADLRSGSPRITYRGHLR